MVHRVFGIRHHGPGCARSLRAALSEFEPDCVLLEGPPDAETELRNLADAGLRPPVALLIQDVEEPRRAVFYPFAVFSPEWQALRYAEERAVPARFIDMPTAIRLALDAQRPAEAAREKPDGAQEAENDLLLDDPIGALAEAAGFRDHEQWWDVQVEQRRDARGLFEGIAEAMTELRAHSRAFDSGAHKDEALREAHMRNGIRRAQKDGFLRIAVVCGAWHVPALVELGGSREAKADNELLKGLPKRKVQSTWIPWTHSRLAFRSGYGAGVDSPGWYAHVWEYEARAPIVFAVHAARLLRSKEMEASSASVIETVRVAEALAVLRELPAPGLSELRDAILAVLCGGDPLRLGLVHDRLEVGEELGSIPEGAAHVPLQRDFEREVRRLRLKLSTEPVILELDLRKDHDRDKSRLFQRLRILGVDWAEPVELGRTSGTFRENWRLDWNPELVVDLVSANLFGNTIAAAAPVRLRERAKHASVPELAQMIELALVADLADALPGLLSELDRRAASEGDVRPLLHSTEPLARVLRYGDVRGTRAAAIQPVFKALLERALAALPVACTQLDDDAAESMIEAMERAHAACFLIEDEALESDWLLTVASLLDRPGVHPRIQGRACRLLLDRQRMPGQELERRARLALGPHVEPGIAVRWLEGLLGGDGLFLVHDEALVGTLDAWLAGLNMEVFQAQLPLLRRAFSSLNPAERRALAGSLRRSKAPTREGFEPSSFDSERARRVLPVLATVLGVPNE